MANVAAGVVVDYFREKNMKYEVLGNNDEIIKMGIGGLENVGSVKIFMIFDNDGESLQLRSSDYVMIPKDRIAKMYPTINALNKRFRWTRFYIDDDGEVMVEIDSKFELASAGELCMEMVSRMASICNQGYPDLMRAMWT